MAKAPPKLSRVRFKSATGVEHTGILTQVIKSRDFSQPICVVIKVRKYPIDHNPMQDSIRMTVPLDRVSGVEA
jgi:hypothetical protein